MDNGVTEARCKVFIKYKEQRKAVFWLQMHFLSVAEAEGI